MYGAVHSYKYCDCLNVGICICETNPNIIAE